MNKEDKNQYQQIIHSFICVLESNSMMVAQKENGEGMKKVFEIF